MALVHEMLYRSEDLARVDFPQYVRALVPQLFRSYNPGGRIRYRVEIDEIVFGVDLAVPCGLIINELVANALKHAFPGDRRGEICVRMRLDQDRYRLSVEDDGIGFPAGLDVSQTGDLGLPPVRNVLEEHGGRMRGRAGQGTGVTIER